MKNNQFLMSALCALAFGCSDKKDLPDFPNGQRGDGGFVLGDGAVVTNDSGGQMLTGPLVEIVSPVTPAAGDFSSDAIETGEQVIVRCRVTSNPNDNVAVDTNSVQISLVQDEQTVTASTSSSGIADEYTATLSLAELRNGPIDISCVGSDIDEKSNTDVVNTFVDHGPEIRVSAPLAESNFAEQMNLSFTVLASPVADVDSQADPDFSSVVASIAGTNLTGLTEVDGVFTGTVLFEDAIFSPSLDGDQLLTISASNGRTSTAVQRLARVAFVADSLGPVINVTSPDPGELVSGFMTLVVNVEDDAGIEPDSVTATVAGSTPFTLTNIGGNQYQGQFDTRVLGTNLVFPNVIVRAQDAAGNESSNGFQVALDNVSPLTTLDSPMMREAQRNGDNLLECSLLFDPLGSDAVDDGQSITQLFEIRARVEDRGNGANNDSGVVIPIASVDEGSVDLFLMDDTAQALIVDTNGDGICDDINPLLLPTPVPNGPNEVARLDLGAITPSGNSFFYDMADFTGEIGDGFCVAGNQENSPDNLCISTPAIRAISATIEGGTPAIYSVPPLPENRCMGTAVDALAANVSDGWFCAAVRSQDQLGNVGISAPQRLCLDSDLSGGECPSLGSITAAGLPDCTGTYDNNSNTVDATNNCTLPPNFSESIRRIDL